ncbi:MAG: HAMP domain-containing protein [Opitutaceae bacterium]|nr:HAMP domain-containing protein [Cytophagales bacterium]
MTIKTKLSLGLSFLFTVILILGGLGTFYLYQLSSESKAIIKDNYESLVYAKNMIKALDEISIDKKTSTKSFEQNLKQQETNITEPQEREITSDIRSEFNNLKMDSLRSDQNLLIRQKMQQLMDVNLQAILRKNSQAEKTSDKAILYMSIIGTLAILISFSFIISFPGFIANPVRILTESIREIANKNYSKRIFFKSDDEFGELASAFNTMAQKLDDYENSNLAQIIFQKKRIETIINTMHDPIIGLDENKNILFANKDAIAILGIQEKNLIGKYAPDVALSNDLMRLLLKEEEHSKPLKIFFADRESYFTKETLEIKTEDKLIGKAIVLTNVTEFKELDSAKTNFIATISHELKTPIASIKMSLKLLEDDRIGDTNEEQKKLINGIKDDSQRLLKITGELLDLTQLESGKINLVFQESDIHEVVKYAFDTVNFQAQQKGVILEVNFAGYIPFLNIDKEKTTWVLVNLLSNAIRYSPEEAKVYINVKGDNGKVIFSIEDSGKGIDPKYKDRIFEKYFKIPEGAGNVHGTGLGLAISKEFIEAQGGIIHVHSELGKGTRFEIIFNA